MKSNISPFTFLDAVGLEFLLGSKEEWDAFLEKKFDQIIKSIPGHPRPWPEGIQGSISHCEIYPGLSLFVAAFGDSKDVLSVGVDLEFLMTEEMAQETKNFIGTEVEYAILKNSSRHFLNDEMSISTLFSAKEALYKLIYPKTKTFLDFDEVCLISSKQIKETTILLFEIPANNHFKLVEVHCLLRTIRFPEIKNTIEKQLILSLAKI